MNRYALIFLLFLFVLPGRWALAQGSVREIRIEGEQRVEEATVLSYLDVRVGDPVIPETLDKGIKSLFTTGLFSDVSIDMQGDVLVVNVVENPVINQIAFEGNDKLNDEELQAEVQLRARQVFTRTKVQADVSRLYQLYRRNGRFSVTIDPKVIQLDQNRVNLVFEVDEGDVTTVSSIRFIGNKHFSDNRLRSEITTEESAWYKFLSSADRYDPDHLAYDEEILRKFYLSQGYADFRLISTNADLSEDGQSFYITFAVEEGERYKVKDFTVESKLRNFDAGVLKQNVAFEKGDWYNADRVQESVDKMTDQLGDLQYAFVNVKPKIDRNRADKTITIAFQIDEAPKVFVEQINIEGNSRTLDKVIRRQMGLSEGDPFSRSKLANSEQKIKDLDYFETVEISPTQGSAPDKTNIDIKVAEKSTGELSLGAGYSTSDGPLADFRIRERNLLGKGQDLLLATTIAGERTEFDVSFTEPYFMDRDLSAGVDLFHITRDLQDESSYDQKRTGGGFRLGYPLSERWRQVFRLRAENNEIANVKEDASRFIRDQEGERTTVALSQRTTYDNRDSALFPTEGWFYWLDSEIAGLADANYVSGRTGASYYYPVMDNVVLNLLGETGAIGGYNNKDVEINERFFIGGTTLRGFKQAGIGPRDEETEDALGGNYFYRSTAELSFPLGLPEDLGIEGHAFTDVGSLWELDDTGSGILQEDTLRAAAGLGVSWRSPFGPVRVDYAKAYQKENFDKTETFRFNFGTSF